MRNALREIDLHGDGILRLREHLRDWAEWIGNWKPKLGYPSSVPYVRLMGRNVTVSESSDDSLYAPSPVVMSYLDAALEDLRAQDEELFMALRIWYLNETVGVSVFRSPRLKQVEEARLLGPGYANEELSRLKEEAERALLPLARKHNVVC